MSFKTRLFIILLTAGLTGVFSFLLVDLSALVALLPGADGRQTARVEFQLPEGAYSTRLSCDEPRYWLFEAEATAPGVDFHARFLLPVYAPARGAF